jgi:hypothetical protein
MSGTYETEEERRRRENEEQIAKEGEEEPVGPQPLTDEQVYPQPAPTEPRVTHVGKTEEEEAAEGEEQPPTEPEAKDDDLP